MKILIGRRRQRNIRKIKEKFQSLHQSINKSPVTVYSRKEEQLNLETSITTDNTQTNVTDGSCEIIFNYIFYDFINNVLPEEIEQTEFKLNMINQLSQENQELFELIRKEDYDTFFNNLIQGVYDDFLTQKNKQAIESYQKKDFSQQEQFQLIIKDSLGNEFCKTNTFVRSRVKEGSSFIIKCPMNDSETTVKDGFNNNEEPQFFYKNMYTNIEVSIVVKAESLAVQNLKSIPITSIDITSKQAKKYNPKYYEVINGFRS